MTPTPEHVKELRQSWAELAKDPQALTGCFYDTLFAIAPDAAALFPGTDMPAQQIKFAAAIGLVVKHADNLGPVLPALAELGRRHASYGVTEADYHAVGAALLQAVAAQLKATFTPATEEAWDVAYRAVAAAMRAGLPGEMEKSA
ncbi:MAG: globin domain-containing protein [Paracoccaceae bacterium]